MAAGWVQRGRLDWKGFEGQGNEDGLAGREGVIAKVDKTREQGATTAVCGRKEASTPEREPRRWSPHSVMNCFLRIYRKP